MPFKLQHRHTHLPHKLRFGQKFMNTFLLLNPSPSATTTNHQRSSFESLLMPLYYYLLWNTRLRLNEIQNGASSYYIQQAYQQTPCYNNNNTSKRFVMERNFLGQYIQLILKTCCMELILENDEGLVFLLLIEDAGSFLWNRR
jgi:hypothetical protein